MPLVGCPGLCTLDVFMHVVLLLDAARPLPGMDASVMDAGWKRCKAVRLPQNVAKVRALCRSVRRLLSLYIEYFAGQVKPVCASGE